MIARQDIYYRPAVYQDGRDVRFRFYAPGLTAFEKANAPEGQRRRIGGIVSTESKDRENEIVLQRGLDFSEFLHHGWFNDNHSKSMIGVLGEPDPRSLRFVRKGEKLPNGDVAKADGHWAEGWLYEDDPDADKVWKKIRALEKSPTGRRLGFSIEGVIQRRAGSDNKIIAKAKVRHVAITHCPVNTDTRLDALAKSLSAVERSEKDSPAEALAEAGIFLGADAYRGDGPDGLSPVDIAGLEARSALGPESSELAEHVVPMDGVLGMDLGANRPSIAPQYRTPNASSVGTGAADRLSAAPDAKALTTASGRALIPQSLEHDAHRSGVMKSELSVGEAIALVRARFPNISLATAGRLVDATLLLKRRGISRREA
jgi:hypothetical protein